MTDVKIRFKLFLFLYFNYNSRFFIVDDGLELKVLNRGAAPGGGGQIVFRCPIRKELKAQQIIDQVGFLFLFCCHEFSDGFTSY